MADAEDKEKAEKLAAAKKRFEQLKKQKAKKAAGAKKIKEETKEEEGPSSTAASLPEEAGDATPEGTNDADVAVEDSGVQNESTGVPETVRPPHGRQPSLSLQSRLRSDSFRRAASGSSPSPGASPASAPATKLPVLSSEGEAVQDIYRKQAARIEQLERDNKRLEKELADNIKSLQKSEAELEELQEGQDDIVALKAKADKADSNTAEIEKLKAEILSLQRQNSHLQSQATSTKRRTSFTPNSSNDDLNNQLASKSSTIESLELEISNLRHQLTTYTTQNATLTSRIETLESSLQQTEQRADNATKELASLKASLETASEDAAKEGSQRSSAETRIILLESDLAAAQTAATDAVTRAEGLEKKIEALRTLHKESEARSQAQTASRLGELDRLKKEASEMRTKLSSVSNENARLREAKAREAKRDAEGDDGGVEDLEDEAHEKLVSRVRDLEAENFDLRRGVWRNKRRELQMSVDVDNATSQRSPGVFDEVDLSGPQSPPAAGDRRSPYPSAFQTVFSAFTGQPRGEGGSTQRRSRRNTQQSQGLLSDDGSMAFDEDGFRAAQEDEARARLERVKELKRGLKQWEGWRVDLVESRGGAMAGVFDV